MKVAVVGCIHGELDTVYRDIERIQNEQQITIDLLLICGDFQAIRNENDFKCAVIPPKFRKLGTFHQYYFGIKKAPVLTIFIGGNHEASNYLITLPYGGWVAPNIYYMGYSNIVRFNGLRIGGISGIYNHYHRNLGHFEGLPMTEDSKRSAYHVRHLEAYRFMNVKNDVDIFMSHDWPSQICHYGDLDQLVRRKPFLARDIETGKLGSPMLDSVLLHLKPFYWFSAHLHVQYEAVTAHSPERETKFLALDKCLPRRRYLQILDLEPSNSTEESGFFYDKEWLGVLRTTDEYLSTEPVPTIKVPELWIVPRKNLENEIKVVEEKFGEDFKIPEDFQVCEPVFEDRDTDPDRIKNFVNPQTQRFCEKVGITDPISLIIESSKPKPNPEEIPLSDDDEITEEAVISSEHFFIDKSGAPKA